MLRKLIALLLLVAVVTALATLAHGPETIELPSIRRKTADERHQTLESFRASWEARPQEETPENEKAERRFLNRLVSFMVQTKRSEVFTETARLWNICYRDHSARYGDFIVTD